MCWTDEIEGRHQHYVYIGRVQSVFKRTVMILDSAPFTSTILLCCDYEI